MWQKNEKRLNKQKNTKHNTEEKNRTEQPDSRCSRKKTDPTLHAFDNSCATSESTNLEIRFN